MFRLLLAMMTLCSTLPIITMQTKAKNFLKLNRRNYAQMTKENFKELLQNERPLPPKIFASKLATMEKDIDDLKHLDWALHYDYTTSTNLFTLSKKMRYNATMDNLSAVLTLMILVHCMINIALFWPPLIGEFIIGGLNALEITNVEPSQLNIPLLGIAAQSSGFTAITGAILTIFTHLTRSGKGAFYLNCFAKNRVYRDLRRQEANQKHVRSLISDSDNIKRNTI